MAKESTLTRREAMQGMAGAAVAVIVPASAFSKDPARPWPGILLDKMERLRPFNDSWRFYRGDGTCVALVRPVGKPGAIEVRADSPGLRYATMRLDVTG